MSILERAQSALDFLTSHSIRPEYYNNWDFMRSTLKPYSTKENIEENIQIIRAYAEAAELVEGHIEFGYSTIVLELRGMYINQDMNRDRNSKLDEHLNYVLKAFDTPNFVDFFVREVEIANDIKKLIAKQDIPVTTNTNPKIKGGYLVTQLTFAIYQKQKIRDVLKDLECLGVVCSTKFGDDLTLYLVTPIPYMESRGQFPVNLVNLAPKPRAKPKAKPVKQQNPDLVRILGELEDELYELDEMGSSLKDKFYELKGLLLEQNQL